MHEVAKYWSFSFSISPSNEHPGLISFRMDWLDLLAVQGTLKSLRMSCAQSSFQFSSVQSLNRVRLFETPLIAARQASLSITNSQSLLKLMSIESVMPSNQSILKEISPGCTLEGLMLKLKLQYFGHLMQSTDSFEKTLMLGKIEGRRTRGRQKMRWLDGIT